MLHVTASRYQVDVGELFYLPDAIQTLASVKLQYLNVHTAIYLIHATEGVKCCDLWTYLQTGSPWEQSLFQAYPV